MTSNTKGFDITELISSIHDSSPHTLMIIIALKHNPIIQFISNLHTAPYDWPNSPTTSTSFFTPAVINRANENQIMFTKFGG